MKISFIHPTTLLLLGAALTAQNTRFIPAGNGTVEGSTYSVYPFGYTNPRCQQVWNGGSITSAAGIINRISYRSDSTSRTAGLPARAYTNVTVELGVTSVTPTTMSTTFATNRTGPMTTVLSGAYNLPAQLPPLPVSQPFNVEFAMTTPFIFNSAQGNLLLDITLPGVIGKSTYFIDAEYSTGAATGTVSRFGNSGSFGRPEAFILDADAQALTPGGALAVTCSKFSQAYPGTLVLGLSNSVWNGLNLPLSLAFLGAPNNDLYVSLDARLPFNAVAQGGSYESQFKAPIPNSPAYAGVGFYLQAYYADPSANAAGLVTTHALALRTAIGNTPETNQMGNADATQLIGSFAFGTARPGGPVTRFEGILP